MDVELYLGDCLDILPTLPDASVQTCVTSPPYFGLRDYGTGQWEGGDPECDHKKNPPAYSDKAMAKSTIGAYANTGHAQEGYRDICGKCGARRVDDQIGLEETPDQYVAKLVDVFREVRRVLRDDGTVWLNLGDSYAAGAKAGTGEPYRRTSSGKLMPPQMRAPITDGLKPKDLIGIPWAVAKALQQPYYAGRITRELDRVWLAATIDAEGTICGFTHVRKDNGDIRRGIHVTITNSNTKMLDEAYRIWGTSKQDHNPHGKGHLGGLDTYRWIAHGVEDKQQLLAELYPYLICKKKQALLAWNFLEISKQARGRNKGKEGDDNREKSAWIVDALSKLNHLEPVDIPSWCKEPPSQYTDGWYLRSDIIWQKPNPLPESVRDRPTKAHEYIFLLTKSARYYYDADAIAEQAVEPEGGQRGGSLSRVGNNEYVSGFNHKGNPWVSSGRRNKRSVWTLGPEPSRIAHFATMPTKLVEPCILAGSKPGDTVLDPFAGSGTTGYVALTLGRRFVGIELNPDYMSLIEQRLSQAQLPLLEAI